MSFSLYLERADQLLVAVKLYSFASLFVLSGVYFAACAMVGCLRYGEALFYMSVIYFEPSCHSTKEGTALNCIRAIKGHW